MKFSDFWASLLLTHCGLALGDSTEGCSQEQESIVWREVLHAKEIAEKAAEHVTANDGIYYEAFFDDDSKKLDRFSGRVEIVFKKAHSFLDNRQRKYTCDYANPNCARKGSIAHLVGEGDSETINFCEPFFVKQEYEDDTERLAWEQCDGMDLNKARRSRSSTIIHVTMHSKSVMEEMAEYNKDQAVRGCGDYASGVNDARRLATGLFNRGCAMYKSKVTSKDGDKLKESDPLCPDGDNKQNEGLCDKGLSKWNADTYTLVGTGLWFSHKCKKTIAFQVAKESKRSDHLSCEFSDTPFHVDDGWDEDEALLNADQVETHVHFGDSYASGMGTGVTSSDKCRVGSNNYGKLVAKYLGKEEGKDFERLSCSGDTSDGVQNQITRWSSKATATIGTMTLGGNDLGFADMVQYCILNPLMYKKSVAEESCRAAINKAIEFIGKDGEDGFEGKLTAVLTRIIESAQKDNFKLYVAGYVPFFDQTTSKCDEASMVIFKFAQTESSTLYLTKDKRAELNGLVQTANMVMVNAIVEANRRFGRDRIFYVDVWNRWVMGQHSWCEEGVDEPDRNREQTYFFLSNWKDLNDGDETGDDHTELKRDGNTNSQTEELQKLISEMKPKECMEEQKKQLEETGSLDMLAKYACEYVTYLQEDPNSDFAKLVDTSKVSTRDEHTRDVPAIMLTKIAKTFHPRSKGMALYRDAVIEKIQANGGISK